MGEKKKCMCARARARIVCRVVMCVFACALARVHESVSGYLQGDPLDGDEHVENRIYVPIIDQ